jgi:hypothetical protein
MSTNENTATEKQDVYQRVTSQIINAIEAGVSNWRMPWHTSVKFAFSPQVSGAAVFLHFDNLNGDLQSNANFDYILSRLLASTQNLLFAFKPSRWAVITTISLI